MLNTLKEFERSGTVPIILALNQLGKGKFTDIHHKSIRMGFRVGSGVVSRRLGQLRALGWVLKNKGKVFILTEKGLGLAKAIKEFTQSLQRNQVN